MRKSQWFAWDSYSFMGVVVFFPAMAPDHIFQVISIAVHGLVFFACHRCISGRWSITTLRSHLDSLKNGQKQISGVANFYCTCLLLNTFRIILPFQPKLDVQIHKSHLPKPLTKKSLQKDTQRFHVVFFQLNLWSFLFIRWHNHVILATWACLQVANLNDLLVVLVGRF